MSADETKLRRVSSTATRRCRRSLSNGCHNIPEYQTLRLRQPVNSVSWYDEHHHHQGAPRLSRPDICATLPTYISKLHKLRNASEGAALRQRCADDESYQVLHKS